MKPLFYLLALIAASSQLAVGAEDPKPLYKQSFETPLDQNPEIQWVTPGYAVTQAVVTNSPKRGEKAVRGNFNASIVDPISNVQGAPFVQFKINFAKIPAVKDWYKTTNKIYVTWWFKLDKCKWAGSGFSDPDPLKVSAKLAYLKMNEDPATSYYLTISGGEKSEGTLSVNDDEWMKLWQTTYNKSSLWLSNGGPPFGSDDVWHKLSFMIEKEGDKKYMTWWMDDLKMVSDKIDVLHEKIDPNHPGRYILDSRFTLDSIQFWHTKTSNVNLSQNLSNGEYCAGWQIDEFQIWDGDPVKPISPK